MISATVEPGITMHSAKACAVVCDKRNTVVMMGTANTAPPTPKKPPKVPHNMPSTLARRGVRIGTGRGGACLFEGCSDRCSDACSSR
ncbi:hypothetical protein D3C73_1092460 [compost metagenome]